MLPGHRLSNRYEIARALGAGGMVQVFLALDHHLGRDVAIKILPPDLAADAASRERLRREARAAAALDHPFACKVFDVGESDGQVFIVMELVVGQTLYERLAGGPTPVDVAMEIAGEIAEALEAAHDLRLVHRDLKPANVMTTSRGHVKVMDFGLAKSLGSDAGAETALADGPGAPITERHARVGTPAYRSPEQIAGDVVDQRSDIFSFGVVLAELLTGVHPFQRPTLSGLMAAVLSEPPVVGHAHAPEVPAALRAVLHRMLEKAPAERYQSMREVRGDLARLRQPASTSGGFVENAAVGHRGRPQRWPMVGRDAERQELLGQLEDALAGHGSMVLIGGEPGIGKTRLTEEVLAEARRRGAFCLVGHCYEGEGAPPYVPFVEITEQTARAVPPAALRRVLGDGASEVVRLMPELRTMFADIPPALELPASQQRRFFFNAYRDFVDRACRANPIAAVFEDLHWADEPTLQLLLHVAQSMTSMRLLLIGTYRDVELDVNRPFAKILETMVRQRLATRMTLRRLPTEGVADLLSAMSGRPAPPSFVRAIFHETEGNPFFVEEVFQHLLEEGRLFDGAGEWRQDLRMETLEVPEGVRLVIGRRLERLSEGTRRILTTAAVLGRTFSLRLLEGVEEQGGDVVLDAVEAAEQAHLLSSEPGSRENRYIFSHELIRQTLIETLSLPRRQRLHAKVAAAIERTYATSIDPHVSAIAHHLYQAGAGADPEKTGDYLVRAADQAREAAAHEDCLAHLDDALSLWEGDRTARVAELTARRGDALRNVGRVGDALETYEDAAHRWHELGDDDRAAVIVGELCGTHYWMRDLPSGERHATRAIETLTGASTKARAWLYYTRALGRVAGSDLDSAQSDMVEGNALRELTADRSVDAAAATVRANFAWAQCKAADSLAAAHEAHERFTALGDSWNAIEFVWFIPWSLYFLGRIGEAEQQLAILEERTTRLGHPGTRWALSAQRGTLEACRGNVTSALISIRRAAEVGEQMNVPWAYLSRITQRVFELWQGADERTTLAALRQAVECEQRTYHFPSARATFLNMQAMVAPDDARAHNDWDTFALHADVKCRPLGVSSAAVSLTEAFARLGDRDGVLAMASYIEPLWREGQFIQAGSVLPTAVVAGIGAWYRGEWDEAERRFERGIEQVDGGPVEHRRGQSREWYAEMLLARGRAADRDRAGVLLGEVRTIYTALGFHGLLRRMREII